MTFDLTFDQQFQQLSGNAMVAGKAAPLRDALVTGDGVGFAVDIEGRAKRFDGRVVDGQLHGAGWKATRK
jgi:hypothetical protein